MKATRKNWPLLIGMLIILSSLVVATQIFFIKSEPNEAKEREIITSLVENWKTIAPTQIPNYPAPTVAFYGYPQRIQFIGNNRILLGYQDDLNPFLALFEYTNDGKFKYVTQQMIESIKPSRWQEWVTTYGSPTAGLNSYEFTSTREGDQVYPSDWVKVSSGKKDF